METLRPQLLSVLDRHVASFVYGDWRNYVLDKAGYTNAVNEASGSKKSRQRSDDSSTPSPTDLL
jgi:hypothetical protein